MIAAKPLAGILIGTLLSGVAAVGVTQMVEEHRYLKTLGAEQAETTLALNQARDQIQQLSAKLDSVAATAAKAAVSEPTTMPKPALVPQPVPSEKHAVRRTGDTRIKALQAQIVKQQKDLEATRLEVSSNKNELEGQLQSTHNELSGSIAKNHEEMVALQKRGERNYYEFNVTKSQDFERVGPITIALHKANTKNMTYNLVMYVEDSKLNKKNVNLYEPIWITLSDRQQPLELVVNRISKNEVHGYLSEPKYRRSELADNSAVRADKAPQLTPR